MKSVKLRKLAAVLAACLFALGLFGCGQTDSGGAGGTTAAATQTTGATQTEAPSQTESAAPTEAASQATTEAQQDGQAEAEAQEAQEQGRYLESGIYRYNEPVDIHALVQYRETTVEDPSKMWLLEWARREMNVNFIVEGVPESAVPDRTSLMFASGDYSEALLNWSKSLNGLAQQALYGDVEGFLRPLNQWVFDEGVMPNVAKAFAENPNFAPYLSTLDGNIYDLPRFTQSIEYLRNMYYEPLWYDAALLESIGREPPKTLDEFRETLAEIKRLDPKGLGENNIPLCSTVTEYPVWGMVFNAYGILANWELHSKVAVIDEGFPNGEIVAVQTHPRFLAMLQFCNSLYADGLMDQDAFTLSASDSVARAQQDYYAFFPSYNNMSFSEESYANYKLLPPMTSEYSSKQMYAATSPARGNYQIFLTDKISDYQAEAAMRFYDHLYDSDFRYNAYHGPEAGVDDGYGLLEGWYKDEEGSYHYKDVEDGKFDSEQTYLFNVGTVGFTGNILDMRTPPESSDATASRMGITISEVLKNLTPHLVRALPDAVFPTSEQSELMDIQSALNEHIKSETARFITGAREPSQAEFDRYTEELNSMGYEKYVESWKQSVKTRFGL
ncbi:MAG: hypothetical protein LBL83_02940 [Clostridiales bacterium]|jgi:putative aldouronate transport system substrate-binding protein|nr:hypothetical protein [Clostridiales bacterium]